MNQTPPDPRRRRLADAASGFPERVAVVLYTCSCDDRDPVDTLAALRKHAEARDWVVHSELYDTDPITKTRTDRKAWPNAARLLKNRDVEGLVAPDETEIALYPRGKERLREWLASLPAFARYIGSLPSGAPGCAPEPMSDTATPWEGYRTGVLVADKETGVLGLTTGRNDRIITVKGLGGTAQWRADLSRLRIATDKERAGLGLAPRDVGL
ncbi:hypothetical protein [Streptomyces sp. UNOC14_S4]|uniref:hypothetical protein n=1 Tax=Streptomyces sp. UNOC14_S4 TaxID=2872340 RepID=UPI001E3B6488|nr:hypothetical protein [Streptomyces sp. UNOC14_S4]MCC3766319.1 hypothetical protein [Streptomyces sp. UNOC14_S4]